MATYEFPSVRDIQAYASAARSGAPPSLQPGTTMMMPYVATAKPRLKLMNNGAIRILGADDPAVLFPPQQPLQPTAQQMAAAVIGRAWDYPVGFNLKVTPRDGQGFGFPVLKSLADNYDVLRGLIERVKDKVVSQKWSILPKYENRSKKDPRCEEIERFLRYPDKQHTWVDWARMLLEQVIVYDAPAIWLRPDRSGKLYGLEIIDGAQITPKIMADGRLPPWDMGPAYQHVIKRGMPAADYIRPVPFGLKAPPGPDNWPMPELLYKPRNPRIDSVYGFSAVEQMIATINIAIRRESYLLGYYSDGSTPDLIFSTPPTWTTQDIANFKIWWDSVLAGNLSNRRGTMFVPDGAKPIDTKEKALTDDTDDWLIRIMCFFLGLNPLPFVKMMNRATSESHSKQAETEGLEIWQSWFCDLFDHIIALKWGYDDIGFQWDEDEAIDPKEQAEIDVMLCDSKIFHPDELRARRGDDPMTPEMRDQMDMATFNKAPNSTILPDDQQAAKDERDKVAADAKAKQMAAAGPPPGTAATKAHELELAKLLQPIITIAPPSITIEAAKIEFPKFEFPPINIAPPAVTVNMPEMKAADVFVDVGAVNIQNKQALPPRGERQIVAKRNPDGTFEGEIIETIRRSVRSAAPATQQE